MNTWLGAIAALGLFLSSAQDTVAQDDLTLRPGDTIIWSDSSGMHGVGFGIAETTTAPDVMKVLEFPDPQYSLNISPSSPNIGMSRQGGLPMLKAKVREDAAASGVSELKFTCYIHNFMVSQSFTVAEKAPDKPPREIKIVTSGFQWVLDNSQGGVVVSGSGGTGTAPVAGGGGMGGMMGMMAMCPCMGGGQSGGMGGMMGGMAMMGGGQGMGGGGGGCAGGSCGAPGAAQQMGGQAMLMPMGAQGVGSMGGQAAMPMGGQGMTGTMMGSGQSGLAPMPHDMDMSSTPRP